jgi:superfamily II DNA/RNA helicase
MGGQNGPRAGVDIIVATPGRLIDHMRQQNADPSAVELLVPTRPIA